MNTPNVVFNSPSSSTFDSETVRETLDLSPFIQTHIESTQAPNTSFSVSLDDRTLFLTPAPYPNINYQPGTPYIQPTPQQINECYRQQAVSQPPPRVIAPKLPDPKKARQESDTDTTIDLLDEMLLGLLSVLQNTVQETKKQIDTILELKRMSKRIDASKK